MSLAAQLSDQQKAFRQKAPQETQNTMNAATNQLAASGIVDAAPKKGEKLADFELPNQAGEKRSLEELRAKGPVVVTFYRGGWCPYCNIELRAWQQSLKKVTAAGASLVAITPELPDESLTTIEKNDLGFEVLTDADAAYARTVGLVFTLPEELKPIYSGFGIELEKHNGAGQFDLPLAATFVIDKDATIASAYVNADHTKRQEPSEALEVLTKLQSS